MMMVIMISRLVTYRRNPVGTCRRRCCWHWNRCRHWHTKPRCKHHALDTWPPSTWGRTCTWIRWRHRRKYRCLDTGCWDIRWSHRSRTALKGWHTLIVYLYISLQLLYSNNFHVENEVTHHLFDDAQEDVPGTVITQMHRLTLSCIQNDYQVYCHAFWNATCSYCHGFRLFVTYSYWLLRVYTVTFSYRLPPVHTEMLRILPSRVHTDCSAFILIVTSSYWLLGYVFILATTCSYTPRPRTGSCWLFILSRRHAVCHVFIIIDCYVSILISTCSYWLQYVHSVTCSYWNATCSYWLSYIHTDCYVQTPNSCLRHTSFRRQVPESGVRSVCYVFTLTALSCVQTDGRIFRLTFISRGADARVTKMAVDTARPVLTPVGHTVVDADVAVLARPACTYS